LLAVSAWLVSIICCLGLARARFFLLSVCCVAVLFSLLLVWLFFFPFLFLALFFVFVVVRLRLSVPLGWFQLQVFAAFGRFLAAFCFHVVSV